MLFGILTIFHLPLPLLSFKNSKKSDLPYWRGPAVFFGIKYVAPKSICTFQNWGASKKECNFRFLVLSSPTSGFCSFRSRLGRFENKHDAFVSGNAVHFGVAKGPLSFFKAQI